MDERPPEIVLASLLGDGAEHAEVGIFIYDDRGRYVSVNRCGAELLGYDRSELLAHDVGDFTDGGIDRSVLTKPERREGIRVIRRKDGTQKVCAFVVSQTRVAGLAYHLAVVWELPDGDPRADSAT
jgi:PAS domain S-box-containing protein